jgi:hypothetical protein
VLAFTHEPTLEVRLRETFHKHLEVAQAIVGRSRKARSDFIKEVVDARNNRAHFGEGLEGKATRGQSLIRSTRN